MGGKMRREFARRAVQFAGCNFAIFALVSDEWIRIADSNKESRNAAHLDDNSSVYSDNYYNYMSPFIRADRCKEVGIRHFWRTAKFGSFVDVKGVYHTTYHFDGKVLVDCITPLVANLFYILIAFCFVIVVKSTLACILSIVSTTSGFLNWLKRNTILEISSMMLAILSCIITVFVGAMINSVNPFSGVTIGAGSVLVAVSGISSFFAAAASLRRKYRIARQRRLENQRLLCARSLRSWREEMSLKQFKLLNRILNLSIYVCLHKHTCLVFSTILVQLILN
ncbi:Olfactory receptor [Dirofilaria immitis]